MFTVALLVALAIVTLWWQLSERRARHLSRDLEGAGQRLHPAVDSMAAARSPVDRSPADLQDQEIARLERRGLRKPLHALREDLVHHPELIPFKGVHGGTMFFDTSSVVLLPSGWAFARFEDGHIAGRGILEYRVGGDGRISWRRVAAQLD